MFKLLCNKLIHFKTGIFLNHCFVIGQLQKPKTYHTIMKRKQEETSKEEKTTKITKNSEIIKIINWNVNGFNALLKVTKKKN